MRILFLTAFVPHDGAAAEKNTKLMLEDLSQENIVDLVYFRYKEDIHYLPPNNNVNILYSFQISTVRKLFHVLSFPFIHPIFSVRFNWVILMKLKRLFRRTKYDVIICDHSQMFLYGKFLSSKIRKIYLSHDVIIQRVQRTSSLVMQKLCFLSEKFCLQQKNTFVFSFCQKDCDLIIKNYGINALLCLDYIDPLVINSQPNSIENYYVFLGKWSRADNLDGVKWFIKEVTPLITKKTNIKIIGKNFPVKILDIENSNVSFEVLGFVDNPYSIIANAKAMLAPLFTGAGIKVKVIESLACGTPVIGTDIAFEGIDSTCSDLMLFANSSFDFAAQMNNSSISLEKRIELKHKFISSYTSITIPNFLKQI